MDSLIEFRRRVEAILSATADDKAAKLKQLDELLVQMVDAINEAAKLKKKVESAKNEREKALEKYEKILEPLKMYKSALTVEFNELRKKNAAKLGKLLSRLDELGAKATASTDACRARFKAVDQESEMVALDEVLEALKDPAKRMGDLGYKVEQLMSDWLESGSWNNAKPHIDKVLKHDLLNAKEEAEKRKADFQKKIKELKKQQQDEGTKATLEEFQREIEEAEAESQAASDAVSELGSSKSSSLQVEADEAPAGDSILGAILDKADEPLDEAEALMEEMMDALADVEAAAGASSAAPEAPSEMPSDEPEMPAEEPAEAPAEEHEMAMEPAAASLNKEADDARDPAVMGDEPLPDLPKEQEKNQRAIDTVEKAAREVLKKFDSNKSQLHLVNKMLQQLKASPEIQKAVEKHSDAAEKWSEAHQKIQDLEAQALELMKALDMKEHEVKDKIKVWVDETKSSGLSEEELSRLQSDAEAFQGWAAKLLDEKDNAALQKTIEDLNKSKEAVDEVFDASISIKDKPTYPPGTADEVKKRRKEFEQKFKEKKDKETQEQSSSLRSTAADVGSAIDQWVENFESAIESLKEFADGFMSKTDEMLGEIPASAGSNAWIKKADYREYPSEHDMTGGFWELVEGEGDGKGQLVINKDLKSRVTKRLKDLTKGKYYPGQKVALDLGDHQVQASIKQYVGDGQYDVEADGITYRAPADSIFTPSTDLWR